MNSKWWLGAAALVAALGVSGVADADLRDLFGGGQGQQQASAPKVHPINDDASFAAKTKKFGLLPFNKADLEFSIRLPDDWEMEVVSQDQSQALSGKILSDVVRFTSPMIGTARAVVTIQTQDLVHEIDAKNWLRNYIYTSGYALQEDVTAKDNRHASAYYILVNEGRSTNFYASVTVNGSVLMLARFEIPLGLQEYISYLQKKSIDSFSMVYQKDSSIEKARSVSLIDALRFNYPASWEATPPDFKDVNRLSIQLQNKSPTGVVEGFVRIAAVRRNPSTSFSVEVDRLKQFFGDVMGLDFKKLRSSEKLGTIERFLFDRYEIYDVQGRKENQGLQDLHLVVLCDKEWYIFAFLITPREQDNLYTWARNVRSFELIAKSIR